MDDKEKPVIEQAADKINDVVEEITLKAADAAIEPDPSTLQGRRTSKSTFQRLRRTSHCRATLTQSPMIGLPVNGKSTSSKLSG